MCRAKTGKPRKGQCFCVTTTQQNEVLIINSVGTLSAYAFEKEEPEIADDEDGKPETRSSENHVAGRVTFAEIIIVVDVLFMLDGASSGEDSGTMCTGCDDDVKRIIMMRKYQHPAAIHVRSVILCLLGTYSIFLSPMTT
jgi:hypothetical protein